MREKFENWYKNQKLDQVSTWHEPETLEFGKEDYPNGRYTIFSTKQMCWEVWQASMQSILISDKPPKRTSIVVEEYCDAFRIIIKNNTDTPDEDFYFDQEDNKKKLKDALKSLRPDAKVSYKEVY